MAGFLKVVQELGLEPTRPSGKPWTGRQVLGIARKRRLDKHVEYASDSCGMLEDKICDLGQTPKHSNITVKLGCLTRRCWPWSIRHGRILYGLEKLQSQGMPIWSSSDTCWCALGKLYEEKLLDEKDANILAGNGMATRAIASALLFGLSITERV